MDLYRINLNLLIALDMLLQEQSVTQAAKKLFITQAAMSNNLQQLRELFKDDLLVRGNKQMSITAYARELQPKLHQVLQELHCLITSGHRFNPITSTRTFKIGVPDYMASILLDRITLQLQQQAPNIKLTVLPCQQISDPEQFERGDFELALGKFALTNATDSVQKQLLFKDDVVCLLNKDHPLAKKTSISLDDFLAYKHITICSDIPGYQTVVDQALQKLNKSRQISIGVPFMSAIFKLLEVSRDLMATVINKIAILYQHHYDFVVRPIPLTTPPVEIHLSWHKRYENDPGHRWFRELILAAFTE